VGEEGGGSAPWEWMFFCALHVPDPDKRLYRCCYRYANTAKCVTLKALYSYSRLYYSKRRLNLVYIKALAVKLAGQLCLRSSFGDIRYGALRNVAVNIQSTSITEKTSRKKETTT